MNKSASVNEPNLELFPSAAATDKDYTSTFAKNMNLPVHRWFRFTAGFSALWVRDLLNEQKCRQNILDPFVGSGTVQIESKFLGQNSLGIEAQPFLHRIAKIKLNDQVDSKVINSVGKEVLQRAQDEAYPLDEYPPIIQKCYPDETLTNLNSLRKAYLEVKDQYPDEVVDYIWLVITAILRESSPVGTAQWQYVLPNKKSSQKYADPLMAYNAKLQQIVHDLRIVNQRISHEEINTNAYHSDARNMKEVHDDWADLVITSPPYANNYDYADATRLELSFWGEIHSWGDLQDTIRKYLLRACTQHVSKLKEQEEELLHSIYLKPIKKEFTQVFNELKAKRETQGGKKNYHLMALAYFYDLAQVFFELRRVCKNDAKVCFVIGDSAPYGIYLPVDRWLGELALHAEFSSYSFEKLRDRNVKWKNRKHRIPLQEGRLWIQ
ncbi:MAG: DNA modification methylase [Bacteroidetes bacterium SW_11_45_7]|nr:MAG: DNA modification methylase [Bacteroidetes bacterium SW_11_45_7]